MERIWNKPRIAEQTAVPEQNSVYGKGSLRGRHKKINPVRSKSSVATADTRAYRTSNGVNTTLKPKVFVAMSGGVDSSVAAALLVRDGYDVTGVFMKNWSDTKEAATGECAWKADRRDAAACAAKLNIPFVTFDFEKEYRQAVVSYLYKEYAAGRTPNPDIPCNRDIKFNLFLRQALRRGADAIATGHYARIVRGNSGNSPAKGGIPPTFKFFRNKRRDKFKLLKGVDKNKDQSYFLHALGQKELGRTLFPIGHLKKNRVRQLARRFGLPTAEKKDSQGICFVGKVNMKEFLSKKISKKRGPIMNTAGKVIGEHDGVFFYTIGQRHGLGLGGGEPYYVVDKDAAANTIVVGHARDPRLFKKELTVSESHWVSGVAPRLPFSCQARIRYRQPLQKCVVKRIGNHESGIRTNPMIRNSKFMIHFSKPQRAVTPGQFIVFYKGEEVLGGGVID